MASERAHERARPLVTAMFTVLLALCLPSLSQGLRQTPERENLGEALQFENRGLKNLASWMNWWEERDNAVGNGATPSEEMPASPFTPPVTKEPEAPVRTFTPPPSAPTDGAMGGGSCSDPMVADMIAKHNEYRTNGPLTCNDGGSQECMNWSRQMCQTGQLSHGNAKQNAEAAGFNSGWAENVLYNYGGMDGTVAEGFEQWRTSPGHDQNMRGDYEGVGCGWYQCEDSSIMWTCIYGNA